jgi:hypothetical protein
MMSISMKAKRTATSKKPHKNKKARQMAGFFMQT